MTKPLLFPFPVHVAAAIALLLCRCCPAGERDLHQAVTLYASFDKAVQADHGKGGHNVRTRFDHAEEKGRYVFEDGFDSKVFRIAKGKGVAGGALEAVDVLPRRGRIFFPAKDNLAFKPDGWSGAVSVWLNTDPNRLLKTPYCDPVQITHKGASNGGLWVDFPDTKPRDLRMGAFRALADGEKPVPESDPQAPLIRVKDVGFRTGDWHHVVMVWNNFDTGRANATAALYIDGKPQGLLRDRDIAMRWELEQTGVYFAVNYIGLLDELAVFGRALTAEEVKRLCEQPGLLQAIK